MPYRSTAKHRSPYRDNINAEVRLKEVETPLRALTAMQLHVQTKKRMLNHALWLVVELTGSFYGRYRSRGVLDKEEIKIQRDHVFPRKQLVEELLGATPNFASVMTRAQCYCVVTHEEHERLTEVPVDIVGWDRYEKAGVCAWDMASQKKADTAAHLCGQSSFCRSFVAKRDVIGPPPTDNPGT